MAWAITKPSGTRVRESSGVTYGASATSPPLIAFGLGRGHASENAYAVHPVGQGCTCGEA